MGCGGGVLLWPADPSDAALIGLLFLAVGRRGGASCFVIGPRAFLADLAAGARSVCGGRGLVLFVSLFVSSAGSRSVGE